MTAGAALGLLEVRGLAAAIFAIDAMAKAAPVEVLGRTLVGDGLVTLSVLGEIAAVDEALSIGRATAARNGSLVAWSRIGRPVGDLLRIFELGTSPTLLAVT